MAFKPGGNDLVRCRLCRAVIGTGEDGLLHYRKHGLWEIVLWHWDQGGRLRGRVLFDLVLCLAAATSIMVLLRSWLGPWLPW
ncbi:hypothetical protein AB0F93_00495 [Micromonospora tulbaghiae]|uniref:hypothetical protein n=1 Tax=Micromonospora tulbaghiae TaxID=479978 RepID=UPI00331868B1